MKISELIELAEDALFEYGDIEVAIWPYDGQQQLAYAANASVEEYDMKSRFFSEFVSGTPNPSENVFIIQD